MITDDALTDEDRTLLHAFFPPAAGAVPPQPRPVWFELADDGGPAPHRSREPRGAAPAP